MDSLVLFMPWAQFYEVVRVYPDNVRIVRTANGDGYDIHFATIEDMTSFQLRYL